MSPMKRLSALLFFVLSFGCESPMNNRVVGDDNVESLKISNAQFTELGVYVTWQWLGGPVGRISARNQLLVTLKSDNGPVDLPEGLSLEFYSTMPSMGHPLEDAGYFERLAEGVYLNTEIRFNMPGDWRHELWLMNTNFEVKERLVWDELF